MSNPVQRDGLFASEADGQVIVYDSADNQAHCLSPVAAQVWAMCDGRHDVAAMVSLVQANPQWGVAADEAEAVVDAALARFAAQNMLTADSGISRRAFGGKVLTPALAAALMVSLFVPMRAAHASTGVACNDLGEDACLAENSCMWVGTCIPLDPGAG